MESSPKWKLFQEPSVNWYAQPFWKGKYSFVSHFSFLWVSSTNSIKMKLLLVDQIVRGWTGDNIRQNWNRYWLRYTAIDTINSLQNLSLNRSKQLYLKVAHCWQIKAVFVVYLSWLLVIFKSIHFLLITSSSHYCGGMGERYIRHVSCVMLSCCLLLILVFHIASGLVGTHWLFNTLYGHPPLIWGIPIAVKVIGMIGFFNSYCQVEISTVMHWKSVLYSCLFKFLIAINLKQNCQTQD